MVERKPRNTFAKAATEKADEIGHPVDPETREEAESTEDTRHEHELYEGVCQGGPMDGMSGQSRYPKGFLLVDTHNSRAWVYDYDAATNLFTSREKDVHDRIRGLRAAEESNYDVRAFDKASMKGHP